MYRTIQRAMVVFSIASAILAVIFFIAAFAWILITDMQFSNYFVVLSNILKNGGTYSTLIAALLATTAFQNINDTEVKRKEAEEKIKEIGQYSLAAILKGNLIETCGDIIVARDEKDYGLKFEKLHEFAVFNTSIFNISGKTYELAMYYGF